MYTGQQKETVLPPIIATATEILPSLPQKVGAHLGLSEILPEDYSGHILRGKTTSFDPWIDAPSTKQDSTAFWLTLLNNGLTARSDNLYYFFIGRTLIGIPLRAFISPADALILDLKSDDGIPITGSIQGNSTNCINVANEYNIHYTGTANTGCSLQIRLNIK
jgi:hypothetical protein